MTASENTVKPRVEKLNDWTNTYFHALFVLVFTIERHKVHSTLPFSYPTGGRGIVIPDSTPLPKAVANVVSEAASSWTISEADIRAGASKASSPIKVVGSVSTTVFESLRRGWAVQAFHYVLPDFERIVVFESYQYPSDEVCKALN